MWTTFKALLLTLLLAGSMEPQITTSGGAPGGSTTQVQYNNAGAFAGAASATINPAGNYLTVSGAFGGNAAVQLDNTTGTRVLNIGANTFLDHTGNLNLGSAGSVQAAVSVASTTFTAGTVAFASLGSVPAAGIFKYCTDCTTAATCAGAGSGHMAVSNGTNWTCQ